MTTFNLENLPDLEIEKMALELHFKLLEDLNTFVTNSQQEKPHNEALDKQVSTKMRQLDEYHAHLFIKEQMKDEKLSIPIYEWLKTSAFRLEKYQSWRFNKLEDELESLVSKNIKKWRELSLGAPLYDEEKFVNHWNITKSRSQDDKKIWCNLGDIHTDLTPHHIIASYIKGSEVKIFHGSQIRVEGQEFYGTLDNLESEPKGMGASGLPQVEISESGEVSLNMEL